MYRQCGMLAIVLSVHRDENGEIVTTTHDWTKELSGMSLSKAYPKWKDEALRCVEKFGSTVFDAAPKEEGPEVVLPLDNKGRPMLPAKPGGGVRAMTAARAKVVLAAFLCAIYRKCRSVSFSGKHTRIGCRFGYRVHLSESSVEEDGAGVTNQNLRRRMLSS
ncbi:hypothetical protein BDN72DRAFT_850870 [Pluteus cervinus]|uniref:Uncharacterized protein n=1 Tax=Pluteus cervinus TaxID=181527 RepID=A0ACD3A305_9AGAR|nr:hypothetical protein BDN72DRAFT_850870 [Pluteus cervinus]